MLLGIQSLCKVASNGFQPLVWGVGFGVWGVGVWGLGFGVWGLGFGV